MDIGFEMTLFPSKTLIPVAAAALRAYASPHFEDKAVIEKLVLALEEAIGNVLFFSGTVEQERLTVRAGTEGLCFCIEVLDKGMPGSFDQTLRGEEALGLAIMRGCVDKLIIENLGAAGRRQQMVKYMASMPETLSADSAGEEPPIDVCSMHFSIREPRFEDMLEVSRGIYREYGLAYYHDNAYIPELFYDAVQKGEIRSIVAVSDDGTFAGHHAFWQWGDIPGVYESGMAVVNKRLRGAGIFNMLMENTRRHYLEDIGSGVYLAYATTFHVFSQKTRLKHGSFPCGFAFNFAPADMCTNNQDTGNSSHSYALVCETADKSEKTVYIPPETVEVARFIYNGLTIPRRIVTEGEKAKEGVSSSITATLLSRLHAGHICALEPGADADEILTESVFDLRRQKAETMELFISAATPAAVPLYETAKRLGFFFAGLVPNTGAGDLLYMVRLSTGVIDYDAIKTCGPFTTLLTMLKVFDPDHLTSNKG